MLSTAPANPSSLASNRSPLMVRHTPQACRYRSASVARYFLTDTVHSALSIVDPEQSSKLANLWRVHTDIRSDYADIVNRGDISDKWAPLAGPGMDL